jgi:hypothetical protein
MKQNMKNNGAQLHSFPTSSLYEGAYLHVLAAFAPREKAALYPFKWRLVGTQTWSGGFRIAINRLPLLGNLP